MNLRRKSTKRRTEAGAAMLIAIFALLLISVIAIALIVSSGTESALAKNYRTSTSAYYAGLAGLEEGRGRLLWRNPNYLNNANGIPGYMPASGNPSMALTQVLYILNPAGAEVVNPTDLSASNPYADKEYQQEFQMPVTSATVQTINSVSGAGGVPGPQFKWVRVTAVTEQSLGGIDLAGDGNPNDGTSPLFYDPAHVAANGTVKPGLVKGSPGPSPAPPTPTSVQALEVTALAVIPPNTQKLLQYVVVPGTVNLSFPSALTIDGNNVVYQGPTGANSALFFVDGNDNPINRSCTTPLAPSVPAIGFTAGGADLSKANIMAGTATNPGNYTSTAPPATLPSVGQVTVPPSTMPPSMLKPSSLNSLVQTITQSADVILSPVSPATSVRGAQLPTSMTPSYPMNVVINGDLDLSGWHNTGYGLLLVTGQLIYDPNASWYGIVLVIGKGIVSGVNSGVGRIQGAMFVAQTLDPANNWSPLPDPTLGAASVNFSTLNPAVSGVGIYYDSCWINTALRPPTYQLLSFREIPLN
jgi:hypothetical protein